MLLHLLPNEGPMTPAGALVCATTWSDTLTLDKLKMAWEDLKTMVPSMAHSPTLLYPVTREVVPTLGTSWTLTGDAKPGGIPVFGFAGF